MMIPVVHARKQLSRTWLIGLAPLFLVMLGQSLTGLYSQDVVLAWLWFLVSLPPLLLIVLLYSSAAWKRRKQLVRKASVRQLNLLSWGYLALAMLILLILQPILSLYTRTAPIVTLLNSLWGLVPFQLLLSSWLTLLFYRREAFEGPTRKILFLAANPKNTARVRIDEEIRDIAEGLRMAKERDLFDLEQRWAVTASSLQQALLDEQPQIVHFSGHGSGNQPAGAVPGAREVAFEADASGGLALEDEQGNLKLVSSEALSDLFRLFKDDVECVLLNACYSQVQAEAIAAHVPFVIGMNQAVDDRAAIAFAVGFYRALGAGQEIPFAFELGKAAIELEGLPGKDIPVLLGNGE